MLPSTDYENILHFISQIQKVNDREGQANNFDNNFRVKTLNILSKTFGYDFLTFYLTDSKSQIINPVYINIPTRHMEIYKAYYYKMDKFHTLNISKDLLKKDLVTYCDLMTNTEFEDYKKSEYYNNLVKRANVCDQVMLPLKRDNTLLGVIGIVKTKDAGIFSKKELLILDKINPYIAFNLKIYLENCRLQYEKNIVKNCINNIPTGIIILDSQLSVLFYNDTANEYCINISKKGGRQNCVQAAVNLMAPSLLSQRKNSNLSTNFNNYTINLFPLIIPESLNTFTTIYSLYITQNTPSPKICISEASKSYHLTARELEIVGLITKGHTNQEIADELVISIHTTKTHIENIFKKSKVHSKLALINKLLEQS